MDPKTLVAGMTIVLIALFILSDRYRKREKEIMEAEANYFESIKKLKYSKNDDFTKKEAYLKGVEYGKKLGMLEEEIEKMLHRDLSTGS